MPADSGGVTAAIIYVDTEGFESTGKSDAYDDRIFALSAIISSLLVRTCPCEACSVLACKWICAMRAPIILWLAGSMLVVGGRSAGMLCRSLNIDLHEARG